MCIYNIYGLSYYDCIFIHQCFISQDVLETSCQEVEKCLQSIDAQFHFVDSTPVSVIPREFKFICCDPNCPPSSDPHYLVLRSGKEQTCRDSLLCDENANCRRSPTLREAYWFPGEMEKSQVCHNSKYYTSSV